MFSFIFVSVLTSNKLGSIPWEKHLRALSWISIEDERTLSKIPTKKNSYSWIIQEKTSDTITDIGDEWYLNNMRSTKSSKKIQG